MARKFALKVLILFSFSLSAAAELETFGARPGYLTSVARERFARESEVVLLEAPPAAPPRWYEAPLVNDKLTREFRQQYEIRFGFTEAQQIYDSASRSAFYEYPGGQLDSIDRYNERQRVFGEYMIRRVAEHQFDNYARNNPDVRPIYEVKDRIANFSVGVRQGYRLRFRYSYSGNFLDIRLQNPYDIDAKVSLQMAGNFGPGAIEDTLVSVGYPVSKSFTLTALRELEAAATTLIARQKVTSRLSATLTGSRNVPLTRDDLGPSQERQDLVLLGLVWSE